VKDKRIALCDVAKLIPDGATVSVSGAWMLVPDAVLAAVGKAFEQTGHPRDLSAVFLLCPGGTPDQPGIEHLALEGLLRSVIGGSFPNLPDSRLRKLIRENRIRAYNLPAGMIASWYREVGAGRPGALNRSGIRTFVDPRLEGGRMNPVTDSDIVSIIDLGGQECLFLPSAPVDVSLIRASVADEAGNLSMDREPASLTALVQAAAARASGGKVIAQVREVVPVGSLHPHSVKVPGTLVDHVVLVPEPLQAAGIRYDPSLCGESRPPLVPATPDPAERWVARRATREIRDGDTVVLGYGISAFVPHLMLEAGSFADATYAIEQGSIGGLPLTGFGFGSSANPLAILDATSQFDLFQGGCYGQAILSFLQVDPQGRVNVHCLDARPSLSSGIGGFLDIAANARRLLFLGYFTAGGLDLDVSGGALRIRREGKMRKFVERLDHISFDPACAQAREILYITERATFRWSDGVLALHELAPGIDLDRDVLAHMDFEPVVRLVGSEVV
jgi:acyl CoA:acetate/3-ketoacid CoA transferase